MQAKRGHVLLLMLRLNPGRTTPPSKVPLLKFGDEVVKDSTAIISRIAAEVETDSSSSSSPSQSGGSGLFGGKQQASRAAGGVSLEEETKWRKWVDERLVKIITANIYRSWE